MVNGLSACHVVENGFLDLSEFGLDLDERSGALLDGGVRVLEAVAGERTDYAGVLNGGQDRRFEIIETRAILILIAQAASRESPIWPQPKVAPHDLR